MRLSMEFEILNMLDEFIAVPVGEGTEKFHGVLKLNEEAADIIRLLAEDTSEEKVVEELLKEYSAPKEELLQYVHDFVEQLRSNDLIIE